MKIDVNTKEIQTALTKLMKVVPKKSSVPVLHNILVSADNDSVTLTATDCDVTISVDLVYPDITESGSMLLQSETIKLIQKLKSNTLTITDSKIYSDNRELNFNPFDVKEYPTFNRNFVQNAFTLPIDKFSDIVDIRYACSDNEGRPTLTGLCIRNRKAIACDAHRLAMKDLSESELTNDIIVPAYALNLIEAFIEKKFNGNVSAMVDVEQAGEKTYHRYLELKFDNVLAQIRLIDGIYPNVDTIIPQSFVSSIKVKKDELLEELMLAKEVYAGKDKVKTVKVLSEGKKFVITASNVDTGNNIKSEIDAESASSDPIEQMGFNVELLLEGLKHNKNNYVTFNVTGKTTPAMIDNDYLVLPYRIA